MIFNIRGGKALSLPVLNSAYPSDASISFTYGGSTSATFRVAIATAGYPDEYAYQWYVNGNAVSGAIGSAYTISGLNSAGTYTVVCKVSNKAGTVTSRTATLTVTCSSLIFFGGALNTTTFGSMSGTYKVSNSKLIVYGGGNNSVTANNFTCSKYVDMTAYSKLKVVIPENDHVKAAIRILNESGELKAAYTVPASSTGTFTLNLSSVSEKCKIHISASSNSEADTITFDQITYER